MTSMDNGLECSMGGTPHNRVVVGEGSRARYRRARVCGDGRNWPGRPVECVDARGEAVGR